MRNRQQVLKRAIILGLACTTFLTMTDTPNSCLAADDITELDTVVVTAAKITEKASASNADISVVTRDMIDKSHYANLTDALRDVPGVTIQNYSNGGGDYTSNAIYVNGTKNVVFLVDGMRVNTNGSTFSKFSGSELVNMDRVERIEVLRGSASTLYGSDASGGVINIITKKSAKEGTKTSLTAMGGSFSTEQYNITHEGRGKDGFFWSFAGQKDLNGDFSDGNGNAVRQRINSTAYDFTVGREFDKDTSLVFKYQSYTSDYLRPKKGGINQIITSDGEKKNSRLALSYKNRLSATVDNQMSLYKNKNYLNDNYSDPLNVWLMDLETVGFSDQITYKEKNHTVVGGFDFYQDKIVNYSSTSYGWTSEWKGKTITNRALYLQDIWQFNDAWKLTSGIRTDNHSVYGNHHTPSFVLGYEPNKQTNYYVSYKEYFVSPNQFELFSEYGSMDLQPETGKTIEFGVNHKFDRTLNGSFNIFKRNAENMIGFNSETYKYYNIGKEDARGWNMQLTKRWNNNFSTNVGYTHLYIRAADDYSNPNRNGALPRGSWNIGAQYTQDKFDMQVNGRGVVNRDGRKVQNVDESFKTFWVWDTALNYKVDDHAKVFIRVNNIFDKFYSDQCYDLNPEGDWYSAPGRNFRVGVTYTF